MFVKVYIEGSVSKTQVTLDEFFLFQSFYALSNKFQEIILWNAHKDLRDIEILRFKRNLRDWKTGESNAKKRLSIVKLMLSKFLRSMYYSYIYTTII